MLRARYQVLFLAFVVLGVYYPVIFAPFCSTDDYRMINSLWNQDSFDIYRLFFPYGGVQYYRPLLQFSFIADKYLWGLEESFMHLENLLLHLGNTLLVFASLRLLFKAWKVEPSPWAPLTAALIFALHPINTEAVAWVSGRTDVLACLFVLLSLSFLARYLAGRSLPALALSGVALLLGSLCKEPALLFAPAALFLLLCHDHRFSAGRPWRERLQAMLLPALTISGSAAVYLVMRTGALTVTDRGMAKVVHMAEAAPSADLVDLVRVVAKLTGFYLKKLFMPLPLNFAIVEVSHYYVLPGALFLALLCYLVYRRNLAGFLAVTGFLICAPCFIVAVNQMSWTPVAERYLYIPSAAFAMALVLGGRSLQRWSNATPLLLALCAVALGGSAYATTSRNMVWQDNYALFADTARNSPGFATAKNDMAVALMKRNQLDQARRLLKSLPIEDSHMASLNLAHILVEEGKQEQAKELLYDRLKADRGYRGEMLELLVKIVEKKRAQAVTAQEKRSCSEELLRLISQQYALGRDPFYQYRLGLVHLQMDDRKAAFSSFSSASSRAPAGSHYRQAALRLAERYRP